MATPNPAPEAVDPDDDLAYLDPHTRLLLDNSDDDRNLHRALLAAVAFHIILLLVTFPNLAEPRVPRALGPKKVYVVEQLRFQPPPAAQQKEVPKKRAKKIPIPDPTPDEPEPLEVEELPEPALELSDIDVSVFGIPDAPPGLAINMGAANGPQWVGNGILPPKKITAPQPRYTEEARKARIQGTVILQAIVDADGKISNIKIIKGLPLGLDLSAIETVKEWLYEPATREGLPVAVYMNLMINFSLQ
jgi:TonB family protein